MRHWGITMNCCKPSMSFLRSKIISEINSNWATKHQSWNSNSTWWGLSVTNCRRQTHRWRKKPWPMNRTLTNRWTYSWDRVFPYSEWLLILKGKRKCWERNCRQWQQIPRSRSMLSIKWKSKMPNCTECYMIPFRHFTGTGQHGH